MWQDIATAPRDEPVLLFYRFGHSRIVCQGMWSERGQCWSTPHDPMARATHWQPLPAPPNA